MTDSKTERRVGILAFDGMEVLDYAGPYEVFNVAAEALPDANLLVKSIGLTDGDVVGRGGFTVRPHATIESGPPPEVLIVPGGAGTRPLLADWRVIDWVQSASQDAELVLSVCTGALVLAAAGLLDNRSATTHHGAFSELAALSPTTTIVEGHRFVQSSDRLWTSAGVSAGIDLALHAVEHLLGREIRDAVVEEMEWGW